MSGPYQGRDLSNCGVGRLHIAINCGVLSVKEHSLYLSLPVVVQLLHGITAVNEGGD